MIAAVFRHRLENASSEIAGELEPVGVTDEAGQTCIIEVQRATMIK